MIVLLAAEPFTVDDPYVGVVQRRSGGSGGTVGGRLKALK